MVAGAVMFSTAGAGSGQQVSGQDPGNVNPIQCPQHVLKQAAQEYRSHLAHRVQQVDNNKQMDSSL